MRERLKNGTVTRDTLREAVYEEIIGISRTDAARFVDDVLNEIITALANEEEVKLHEFGVFKVRHKRERVARNVKTGESATVTARRVVTFKPSILLLNQMAEDDGSDQRSTQLKWALNNLEISDELSVASDRCHHSEDEASPY